MRTGQEQWDNIVNQIPCEDFQAVQRLVSKRRAPGTARWLVKKPLIQRFLTRRETGERKNIWCHGSGKLASPNWQAMAADPLEVGFGKTILA